MIEKVIQTALDEVGYSTPDYNNKYAAYLDEIHFYPEKVNSTVPWCGIFIDWCFAQAFGAETAKLMLYRDKATNAYEAYKAADKLDDFPEIGAQIFFYGDNGVVKHTGIITNIEDNIITFISGNNLINGHSVLSRQISKESKKIAGYGTPNYEMTRVFKGEEAPAPDIDIGQGGTRIIYNGKTIATPEKGEVVTLACAGKKAISDIIIQNGGGAIKEQLVEVIVNWPNDLPYEPYILYCNGGVSRWYSGDPTGKEADGYHIFVNDGSYVITTLLDPTDGGIVPMQDDLVDMLVKDDQYMTQCLNIYVSDYEALNIWYINSNGAEELESLRTLNIGN